MKEVITLKIIINEYEFKNRLLNSIKEFNNYQKI